MAKFRDPSADANNLISVGEPALHSAPSLPGDSVGAADAGVPDRIIGDILAELRDLTAEQVEKVLRYQQEKGVRFGEAAVALGFANNDDVLFALSRQFHYPYAPEGRRRVNPELVTLNEPFSFPSETFRALRSQLMMRVFVEGMAHPALAIISPDPGDGKTYTASNLAVSLAQLGGRTLLVDGDMRDPRVHEVFGIKNVVGLSGILSGRTDKQAIQQVAGLPGLFVLPVGTTPPNPLELLERPTFALLVRELADKFDHVIVDTPAAAYGSDAAVIASKCGAAAVIARKDASRTEALRELIAALRGTPTKLAGVVFNNY